MKQIIILFLLLISLYVQAQQITLSGQVSIHNSGFQTGKIIYVQNANVTAPYTSPDDTDVEGKFNLEFVGIAEGTALQIQVEKQGLEVVNERTLQSVILGRRSNVKVFLTPKGELAKAKAELYDVSLAAITANHDALIGVLRKGGDKAQAVIERLKIQLNKEITNTFEAEELLNQQLEAIKKRLPETIREIAVVNLDFASKRYQEAYELYITGQVEKALSMLDEITLEQDVQQSISNITKLEKEKEDYLFAKEKQLEQVDQIVQNYRLKATLFNFQVKYNSALDINKKNSGFTRKCFR